MTKPPTLRDLIKAEIKKISQVVYIIEKRKPNYTNFGRVEIEEEPHSIYNTLSKEKTKGCSFKNRIADFFMMGLARAVNNSVLLTKLSKNKKNAFNIETRDDKTKTRTLKDKEEFWNYFKLVAYSDAIRNAGSNEITENWKSSHYIIADSQKCTRIAEKFFKGGWTSPQGSSFKELVESDDFSDDIIIAELSEILKKFIEEEEKKKEEEKLETDEDGGLFEIGE